MGSAAPSDAGQIVVHTVTLVPVAGSGGCLTANGSERVVPADETAFLAHAKEAGADAQAVHRPTPQTRDQLSRAITRAPTAVHRELPERCTEPNGAWCAIWHVIVGCQPANQALLLALSQTLTAPGNLAHHSHVIGAFRLFAHGATRRPIIFLKAADEPCHWDGGNQQRHIVRNVCCSASPSWCCSYTTPIRTAPVMS